MEPKFGTSSVVNFQIPRGPLSVWISNPFMGCFEKKMKNRRENVLTDLKALWNTISSSFQGAVGFADSYLIKTPFSGMEAHSLSTA